MFAVAFSEWPDPNVLWAIGISLTLITWAITDSWRKVRRAEIEAGLKHEMLERGMSPEEIERVLRAPRSTESARGVKAEKSKNC
jgi:hypothetical protein